MNTSLQKDQRTYARREEERQTSYIYHQGTIAILDLSSKCIHTKAKDQEGGNRKYKYPGGQITTSPTGCEAIAVKDREYGWDDREECDLPCGREGVN